MSNFTKGPWFYSERESAVDGVNIAGDIYSDDRFHIASSQSQEHLGEDGLHEAECRANLRLISQAPTLLSELEMLSNVIEGCGIELPPEVEGQLIFARASISKAKGECE